jgi:hypothetical protein
MKNLKRSALLLTAAGLLAACTAGNVATGTTVSPAPSSAAAAAPASQQAPSTEPEPEPSEEAPAAVESQSFNGSGDKVLKFTEGPFTAELTHTGSSNFVVYSMDTNLDDDDLMVNHIGKYKGTVLASSDEYGGLRIEGDGKWTAKVTPIAGLVANAISGDTSGTGDSVFAWDIPDRSVVTITHKGDSNFVVYSYTADGSDLLVNEIGNYSGEKVMDSGFVEVQADGKWTLSVN